MDEPRNACYLCDDMRNIFQEEFWGKCNLIYTGSFVEGMANHSDIDMMHVADDFLVVEHPRDIPESFGDGILLMEPELCHPGYTRLRLLRDIPGNTFGIYTSHNGTLYLDRMKYLNIKLGKHDILNVDMHGPALLTFNHNGGGDSDMVECFQCPIWPTFARKDFCINEKNSEVFKPESVTSCGCHIVPIAHPNSSNPDLEFRMSFSVAERNLIRNWNKTQMCVYFLCKELFNKFFRVGQDLEKGLCSYFAKTIIFWMDERYSKEFWTENSTLHILEKLLEILRAYVTEKSCPNYFVPDNFMMSTYTDKQINSLLAKLDDVCQDIFDSIICCNIFSFADNELLASLYKTITLAGDQSNVTKILTSIYLSDFVNGCNKQYFQLGGIKRVRRCSFIHYYFQKFMIFCLGKFLVGVPLHSSQEFLNVRKRLNELHYDSYLMECSNMYINRCLAVIALSALFHIKDDEVQRKTKLLEDTEKMFIFSVGVHSELNDGGVNGGVYLGLFYYLTDQMRKSQQILAQTAKTALEQLRYGNYHGLPVLIMTEKTRLLKCPSFLQNESILRDLFEKWHLHGGFCLDSNFLCLYLLHLITNEGLEVLQRIKLENESSDSDASNYIRYRLGLLKEDSSEFTKYSKKKLCVLCRFEQSGQYK